MDRVSIPDATTSSFEAKLDSPHRYLVLFAYREFGESTIREIHEYLNPPTMPEENISRDEVRDITLALLDMGELRESGEKGGAPCTPLPPLWRKMKSLMTGRRGKRVGVCGSGIRNGS